MQPINQILKQWLEEKIAQFPDEQFYKDELEKVKQVKQQLAHA